MPYLGWMRRVLILLPAVRQRLFALIGALVLATACLQAASPIAAPLERTQGSAFSAATGDVAVVRPHSREVLHQAPLPQLPPAFAALQPVPVAARARGEPFPLRPDSTGPPSAAPHRVCPGPRAPPCF